MPADHLERDLRTTLLAVADAAPELEWDRLRNEGRRRARISRRLTALAAVSVSAGLVAGGVALVSVASRRTEPQLITAPTASSSATSAPAPVDARPTTPPPAIVRRALPPGGSVTAVKGNGWSLEISQGGRGTVGVSVDDAGGHDHSYGQVVSELEGAGNVMTPYPVKGIVGQSVANFSEGSRHLVVVAGGIPRGTASVGVVDETGLRGWATVLDPGPNFDTLFFAYETPGDADVVALQSFDASGRVTSTRKIAHGLLAQPTADPGQLAAAGVVTAGLRPKRKGENYPDLCLTVTATGQQSCMSYFTDGTKAELRLPDGRLAVAGIATDGYTHVTLTITATGVMRGMRLGLQPSLPLLFVWLGDAPQPPDVSRTVLLPPRGSRPSRAPNGQYRFPSPVPTVITQTQDPATFAGVDADGNYPGS